MQCVLLLAFMLAYLAEVDNQLCLLQQGSRRMLGTAKVPAQLCLHPKGDMKSMAATSGWGLSNCQRETGPRNQKEQSYQSKTFWGTMTDVFRSSCFVVHLLRRFLSGCAMLGPLLVMCPQEVAAVP